MGAGATATQADIANARQLGKAIAENGWILLTGGRKSGVMDAASKGAKDADGLTIGILPNNNTQGISDAVDIAIVTDLGNARNNINVLSSDIIIACGMGAGTASEVALAIKNNKQIILLSDNQESKQFFKNLSPENIFIAISSRNAIALVQQILYNRNK